MIPILAEQLNGTEFVSLNLCRAGAEWQASLEIASGKFRIRMGSVPSEAIAALFAPAPSDLPPLPY